MAPRRKPRSADRFAAPARDERGMTRGLGKRDHGGPRAHDPDRPPPGGHEEAAPRAAGGGDAGVTWAPAEESDGIVFLSTEQFDELVRAQRTSEPPL